MNKRYNSINDWLKERFGERIYKVSLESGCACPNRDGTVGTTGCIFCNPASYSTLTAKQPLTPPSPQRGEGNKDIHRQLDTGIEYIRRRHGANKVIAYFQSGSNTHAPADKLAPIFNAAISHPSVVGLAISTRPDCIGDDHIKMFEGLGRKTTLWVEMGLQSAHDKTLKLIKRGHTAAQFASACGRLKAAGIPVCAHVILGLPGESRDMMIETASFLNVTGVWGVKIHNLHVLKGTELERLYRRGEVKIPTLKTYSNWAVDFLEVLEPSIIIHRVNSHSPKNLTVAPKWSINKFKIFNEVEREMERRGTRQGIKFRGGPI